MKNTKSEFGKESLKTELKLLPGTLYSTAKIHYGY